ncbi:CaiB/BaiF CoA transferase family protein [Rhodoplanes sp. Z2-YC6860]|uniref:CaiB/BaiF CoA transferase family protein n=1 Tax=Rhodoplanes sp. Z2-YC6860 TaxID=674703 RepID=UPI00078D80F9|nr:CaiB/BaiF CoA-transferase family protein [Rhodoplanes sp. Z2-YC6860]AMN43998.1 L-carnitine dehydratase/bile acid-inducible protein F [Rhodoplanes sp. Z2-YC6860]
MKITASTALDHLRVLDLTRVRAGPTCCRILADFGADVIKIDAPPGLDPNEGISGARHGYDMVNLHRNKRSITLNLKAPEGREVFMRMLATSDVVVENFRPDVKDRMGLDYESLKAVNPRIILASISGFGQTGPYKTRPGFDQIAQGMGGLMGVTGEPGTPPMRAGIAVADSTSGIFAATGILIALAEREKSGMGQWVQTSLLQSQIAMMDFQAARFLVDHQVPPQAGNDHPTTVPMGVVTTADGYINIGVGGDSQWRSFCQSIERPDLIEVAKYAKGTDRTRHKDEIKALLEPIFKTRTSADWLARFEAAAVPAGPIYKVDQVFSDPQVEHLGVAVPLKDRERGDVRVVGQPIVMSRTPASVVSSVPDAGEHNVEILNEFGYSTDYIARLRERKII